MSSVRKAIHIRTGQRRAADALDDWLDSHNVALVPLNDVYEAAVLLLHKYDDIPDVALVGAEWLASDEFNIITYLRQTWPQVGIVVYGGTSGTPLFDMLPMTCTCRSDAELQRIMADTPAALLARLRGAADGAAPVPTSLSHRDATAPTIETDKPAARDAAPPTDRVPGAPTGATPHREDVPVDAPPRAVLTPDELAALLERQEQ